jgi:hypothetical protein
LGKEFGGDTGHEGFIGRVEGITDQGNEAIRAATDAKAKDAAQTKLNTDLLAAYAEEIRKVKAMLQESERDQRIHEGKSTLADRSAYRKQHNLDPYDAFSDPQNMVGDQSARISTLHGVARQLGYESDSISLQSTNTALTGRKDSLTTANENAQQDRPFQDRMKALSAQLDGVKAKLAAIGQPEAAQTIAKAFGEAQKAIEEVNKALEKQHTQLTDAQKAQITAVEQAIASADAEATWKAQLESTTTATNDRIRSQELLAAAIGKGYEATRSANVETQVMGAMKEHYSDPAFAGDAAKLRAGYGAAYDASHSDQTAGAVEKLREQIELEKQLAAVQSQGAEAVRQATLAHKIKQIAEDNDAASAKVLIQAEMDLYNAERANVDADALAKLDEKIAATQRFTAAVFSGAEAQRQAANESKYTEMARGGAGADEIAAQRALDQAEHEHAVTEEAGRLVTVYGDQVEHLNQIEAAIQKQKKDHGDTLEIEIALRDLENERLKIAVQQELKLKGAQNGLKAFFLEMQEDAKSAADIVYDSLNSALDKVSDQFSKLFTGQKTSFGKMFEGLGQDVVKESTKAAMQKGLGELGAKVFGVKPPAGKADGSSEHPFYVIVKGKGAGAGSPADVTGDAGDDVGADSAKSPLAALGGLVKAGAAGAAGLLGKLFSGGGGTAVSSSISYMASGGDVDPGQGYIVGEQGPEFFSPHTAGSITPNHKLGGDTFEYHIDARGADLGAANRTARAIESAHNAAVRNSVKAQAERTKRTPQRGR